MNNPPFSPPEEVPGAALHPGERECIRCERRIRDEEFAVWVKHDATDRCDRFQHRRCPSPCLSPSSLLYKRWREGKDTLHRARKAYVRLKKVPEPLRSILKAELSPLGIALGEALKNEDRLMVASLVWGYQEWERAHGEVLHLDAMDNPNPEK